MTLCFLERAGCAGGGKGILCSEEKTFTLSTVDNMRVCMEENRRVADLCNSGQESLIPWEQQGHRIQGVSGVVPTLTCNPAGGMKLDPILHHSIVRRLTPTECERLQGFPDGYTNIPWKNTKRKNEKFDQDTGELVDYEVEVERTPNSPDSRRYKALGNSMAVPVMRWIGKRMMEAGEVVYDAEAIRRVMLPQLTEDEKNIGQQMLF